MVIRHSTAKTRSAISHQRLLGPFMDMGAPLLTFVSAMLLASCRWRSLVIGVDAMQIPLIEDNLEIAEVGCPGQDFSLFCRSEGHVELQWCVRSPERKCGLAHIGACDEGISNGCFDEGEFRLGMRNHTESGTRIDLHFQLRNTVLVTCRTLVDVGEGKSIWVYSKPVLISTPSNDEEALAETCQPLADDKISPLTTELASTSAVESSPSPSPTKTYNAASSTSLASPTEMPNVPTTNPAASCLPCPISCKCPENCPISGAFSAVVSLFLLVCCLLLVQLL